MQMESNTHLALTLFCVICDRDRIPDVEDVLKRHKTFFSLVTYGRGTANSGILSYFGLGETEKAVFCCVLPKQDAIAAGQELDKEFEFAKPGKGISFMVKIDNGCYRKPVRFPGDDNKEEHMQNDTEHDLIIVVLNRGYCEDVMDAARGAGATGGTVMNARGCGAAGIEKFFGMVIAPEKELVWMVTTKEAAPDIMAAIADKAGPSSDAGAVSFSINVERVQGINLNRIDVK